MSIINLTPHNVNIIRDGKCVLSIPPTSPPARCAEVFTPDEYPIYLVNIGANVNLLTGTLSYSKVTDLPPPNENDMYVVSVLVAQQFPERDDLYVPYELVRKEGQIIGCKRLVRVVQ
jgi:hypothetical protein